jgi:uncharacterized membrane protein
MLSIVSMLISALVLLVLDIPWLYVNQNVAGSMIQAIQGSPIQIRIIPSIITYLLLAYLLTIPGSAKEAFFLGVATYGVYDATNYATLKNYSPMFAIADTLWGGILLSTAWIIRRKYIKV